MTIRNYHPANLEDSPVYDNDVEQSVKTVEQLLEHITITKDFHVFNVEDGLFCIGRTYVLGGDEHKCKEFFLLFSEDGVTLCHRDHDCHFFTITPEDWKDSGFDSPAGLTQLFYLIDK